MNLVSVEAIPMKNLNKLAWIALGFWSLSSCSVYHNPVYFMDETRKSHEQLLSGPMTINTTTTTNTNTYNWSDPPGFASAASQPVIPLKAPEQPKPVVRRIEVGCRPFVMPVLLETRKLTTATLRQLAPKSTQELNSLLISNIEQNDEINRINRSRIDTAYKDHLRTCKD